MKEQTNTNDSLARYRTDYGDPGVMHRDDKGEWVRFADVVARQGGITSEENGVSDLTDEQIDFIGREYAGLGGIENYRAFARAIERAAIAAHLARQPKAEQPYIMPWQTRLLAAGFNSADEAKDAEIADLRAALARQAQAEPAGHVVDIDRNCNESIIDVALEPGTAIYLAAPVAPVSAQNAKAVIPPTSLTVSVSQLSEPFTVSDSTAPTAASADVLAALQKAAVLLRAAGFAMTGTATSQIVAAINAAAICTVPPEGWQCTRAAGHKGPCAAIPAEAGAQNAEAIRNAALKEAENIARCYDLGTPDGHAIADIIRALQSGTATTKTGDAE